MPDNLQVDDETKDQLTLGSKGDIQLDHAYTPILICTREEALYHLAFVLNEDYGVPARVVPSFSALVVSPADIAEGFQATQAAFLQHFGTNFFLERRESEDD